MSIGVSGNKSNGKTSGTSTYDKAINKTTTATLPDWLNTTLQGMTAKSQDLASADPSTYVAGPDALQTQASIEAGGLGGSPWNFNTAADTARAVTASSAPQTKAVTADGYIDKYQNPWLKDVVNATSADLDANDGRTRAQQSLDLAGSGAFGGSGAALTQSMTEGELSRARAASLGGLRSAGFNTALQAAQADAMRQQEANTVNAGLTGQQMDRSLTAGRDLVNTSTAYDANNRANIGAKADMGTMMQGIAQKFSTAPLELQSWLKDNLSPLLQGLFGQTEVGTESGTEASTGKSSGSSFGFSASNQKPG